MSSGVGINTGSHVYQLLPPGPESGVGGINMLDDLGGAAIENRLRFN